MIPIKYSIRIPVLSELWEQVKRSSLSRLSRSCIETRITMLAMNHLEFWFLITKVITMKARRTLLRLPMRKSLSRTTCRLTLLHWQNQKCLNHCCQSILLMPLRTRYLRFIIWGRSSKTHCSSALSMPIRWRESFLGIQILGIIHHRRLTWFTTSTQTMMISRRQTLLRQQWINYISSKCSKEIPVRLFHCLTC